MCCFKPFAVWSFVVVVIGHSYSQQGLRVSLLTSEHPMGLAGPAPDGVSGPVQWEKWAGSQKVKRWVVSNH